MPEIQDEKLREILEAWGTEILEDAPQEINSGAIFERGMNLQGEKVFCVEANTSHGLRKFVGTEEGDPQSQPTRRPYVRILKVQRHGSWKYLITRTARSQTFFWPEHDGNLGRSSRERFVSREPDAASIVNELKKATGDRVVELVCDLEAVRLRDEQRDFVQEFLFAFIGNNRESTSTHTLTAVGAAMRKYIAILDVNHVSQIASLLETGHRVQLSLDLELEVVKMLARKFEANPPEIVDSQEELSSRLWELARDYMRPRVLLRDNYATVASLAVEAIVAMRSSFAAEAFSTALSLPYSWFGEVVSDNLNRLASRWAVKDAAAAEWCRKLIQEAAARPGEKHAGEAR